jgi:DNA repair protein RadC
VKIYELKALYTAIDISGRAEPLSRPEKVCAYMAGAFIDHPEQEQFWVILLNRRNYPKGRHLVTVGTLTSTLAHPREVLRPAISGGAAALVCCHNHPSGDPSPSAADIQLTRQLRDACTLIDIPMLDHIIIGEPDSDPLARGYYSFREAGLV